MNYDFHQIEKKWQNYWKKNKIFELNRTKKLKYYILNMFPYPSGQGLHVGHLIGYIASDIYTRYKIAQGYNVLNPIGFDSFGLPTEHYAINQKTSPKIITDINIKTYKNQLNKIGLAFNWKKQLYTSDPKYYKWTQFIFINMFNSWFNKLSNKAENINKLIMIFNTQGSKNIDKISSNNYQEKFTKHEWLKKNNIEKEIILQNFRLIYKKKTLVNWCPELNTVLANDEIKSGKSERGGYPVIKKEMNQWHIRTTAYAKRLLQGLNNISCSNSLKKTQTKWIGETTGVLIFLSSNIKNKVQIFNKHVKHISHAKFIIVSTCHYLTDIIINKLQNKKKILSDIQNYKNKYHEYNTSKIENIFGIYTTKYAIHPTTYIKLPIYISNDIIEKYHVDISLGIPIKENYDMMFYKKYEQQIENDNKYILKNHINNNFITHKNYKIRDAILSRQRYWGEPIPIYYKNNTPYTIPIQKLPLKLPHIKKNIISPLTNITKWAWHEKKQKIVKNKLIDHKKIFPLETDTMPSWAGSSWYYIRYINPKNTKEIINKKQENYWKNIDTYIGGSEHATGHLIYARMFHKFLKDINIVTTEEPFKKIINQGIVLNKTYILIRNIKNKKLISYNKNKKYSQKLFQELYINNNIIKNNNEIDKLKLTKWKPEITQHGYELINQKLISKIVIEKMSKSKFNTINPDDICIKYGADALRVYEMFFGPFTHNKIWNIKGITGAYNFLHKIWKLFYNNKNTIIKNSTKPTKKELYILHKSLNQIIKNIELFNFNVVISELMILLNKIIKINCLNRKILESIIKLINLFAPHISEEIWEMLGYKKSICLYKFPKFNPEYIKTNFFYYPVMINNKFKFKIKINNKKNINNIKILIQKYIKEKYTNIVIKQIIIIPNKIINVVT